MILKISCVLCSFAGTDDTCIPRQQLRPQLQHTVYSSHGVGVSWQLSWAGSANEAIADAAEQQRHGPW
jgi:hypothetical protein